MVLLTRLDGTQVTVNCDHILTLEQTPDTVVLLTSGGHLMCKESVDEVVERVVAFRRRLGPQVITAQPDRSA
jgi:flagellar protein FlbD